MMKLKRSLSSILALLLIVFQFAAPIGNVMAADKNVLLPPSNLAYQATTPDDGKLVWKAVNGAAGYNVYDRSTGKMVLLGKAKTNNYTLSNQTAGKHSYVVSTLGNNVESGPCAPVNVTITYPVMKAPLSLTGTLKNVNDIVLSWGTAQYADTYKVYQIAQDGTKKLLTTTTAKTYTITNAAQGKLSFTVSAVNSLYGESKTATPITVNVVYPVIKEPLNLTASLTNGNDINLKWTAAANAKSYNVYQVSASGQEVLKTTVSSPSAVFKNMPAGDYVFKIYTVSDRFGASANGSKISVTVAPVTMVPPNSVTYKQQNINDVVLTWGKTAYATAYKVYQIVNGQKVLKDTLTGATITYKNQPGGDYTYAVSSYSDRFGESTISTPVSFTISTVTMAPPNHAAASLSNINDINLSWDAAPNADSYKVYQVIDGQKELKTTVNTNKVSFTNMPAGDYVYVITSYSSRFGESDTGSTAAVTIDPVTMTPPANFAYQINNGNDISLTWDTAANADSYRVYQIVGGKKVLKTTATKNSAIFTNAAAGDYSYQVYSYNSRFGESADGASLSFTLVLPVMAAPANIVPKITGPASFTLSWDASPYATSYKVYQIINGTKTLKNTVTAANVSFSNMKPGQYDYEIHAFSSRFGESKAGSTVSIPLTGLTLGTPANLSYTISNGNDIKLTWSAAQNATSYKVYRMIAGKKVLQNTTTATSYTCTNQPSGDYDFIVDSYDTLLGESSQGAELKFTLVYPTMNPPASLTGSIQNSSDIVLKWSSVPYADSYKVYEMVNGQEVLVQTVANTTATISKVTAGAHSYVIHSVSSRFGESKTGSTAANFTVTYPADFQAPVNVTAAVVNGNGITLKWSAAKYATSYNIYQTVDGVKTFVESVKELSAALTNMPEGDYSFEVETVSDRFGESTGGIPANVTLSYPGMQAPANFTSTITNGNDITLSWGASDYATDYKVYSIANGKKTLVKDVTANTVTFSNMPEGNYTYEVDAYNDHFGESSIGSTISCQLTWPTVEAPVLGGTISDVNDVTLSWNSVAWADEYRLYEVNGNTKVLIYSGKDLTYEVDSLSQGTHTYQVTAYNTRFGESALSNQANEKIVYPKMQAPAVSLAMTGPESALLSWDLVSYANGYNVYEMVNGNPVLLVKNLNGSSYAITNLSNVNHLYYVTSYSNSFGESTPSNTVQTDLTAPVTTSDITSDWKKDSQTVNLSATDDLSGVAHTYYSINGAAYTEGTTFTINLEGVNQVSFYSVDLAGNKEDVHTVEVKIDKTAPVTSSDAPADWVKDAVQVNLTADDNLSGIAHTYYSINGAAYTEGTTFTINQEGVNQVSYYSVDIAGNVEATKTVYVKIDKTAPGTKSDAPSNWVKDDVQVNLTADDNQSGVAATYYSINGSDYTEGTTFTVNQEGVNVITFYSVDNVGIKEHVQTVIVKIDKTAPVTQTTVPADWVKNNVQVNLSASDNLSGVAKTYYSINGSAYTEGTIFTVSQEGDNVITYYTVDQAGNKEAVKTIEVKIDKTAPVTSTDAPSGWVNNAVQVSLTASDSLSGAAHTYYSINGSGYVEGKTFTVSQEGINQVSYYSADNAGNIESIKTITVKIDKTAPVTGTNAPSGWSKNAVQVNLIASDSLSGAAHTYYSVNGSGYVEGTTVTVSQEGVNQVSYYSVDNAGNIEAFKTVAVKIDKTAPVTSTDAPTGWVKTSIQVNFTASDSLSGAAKTYYSINGSDYLAGTTCTVAQEGVNQITYYSVDNAGNTEAAQTVIVKIDKTAPGTSTDAPVDWINTDVQVNLTADDSQSGVAHTYYSLNGSAYTEGTTFMVTTEGSNQVSYYSVDNAGNIEHIRTVAVKIDKTAPVTSNDAPAAWVNNAVQVHFTVNDNLSGAAHTYYSVNGSAYVEGTICTVAQEGVNTLTYYSVDNAGNTEPVQTVEVKIDKTAPVTSNDAPADWVNADVQVNLSPDDSQSGVSQTYYSVNGSAYKEGTTVMVTQEGVNQVSYYSVDNAGNVEATQTAAVKIDKTAPVTRADLALNGSTVQVNFTADDSGSGVAKTYYSINGSAYVEGTTCNVVQTGVNLVSYYSVDNVGNTEGVKTVQVVIN